MGMQMEWSHCRGVCRVGADGMDVFYFINEHTCLLGQGCGCEVCCRWDEGSMVLVRCCLYATAPYL